MSAIRTVSCSIDSMVLTGWYLRLNMPMLQAFEIDILQNVRPDAGFAAQLGGVIANAVEADVERQVTSAVEGKKQVRGLVTAAAAIQVSRGIAGR